MRRLFCQQISAGSITLDDEQAHHARSVLRLLPGATVELFDFVGRIAIGTIEQTQPTVTIHVNEIRAAIPVTNLHIASAVPKGDRADWLVEKLSEIGVSTWTPLRTARSVVHPEGTSKHDRWQRIATEAAKQSRRVGVMQIATLTDLESFLQSIDSTQSYMLSTRADAVSIYTLKPASSITLLIGPEGGWTDEEETTMANLGLTAVSLGRTILRVETAAMVAAGFVSIVTGAQR